MILGGTVLGLAAFFEYWLAPVGFFWYNRGKE
jgi:hypothetical protein